MVNNPVRWFEIYVNEMARAKKFYESVFNVKLTEMTVGPELEMWGFPSNPEQWGCSGTLVKMPGFRAGGNSTIIYFGSDNCLIEEKRIVEFGGKIFKPKMSIGQYGFITLAYDTEGNMIGVHSME